MATIYDSASLVMIPSGYKEDKLFSIKPTDGSGDFTFERGSDIEATRVNSSGLIEKAKVNLLLQSNSFDTTWSTTSATLTSGQTGYDGSSDAWQCTTTSSGGSIYQSNTSGGVQTFSVYAKGDGSTGLRMYAFGSVNNSAFFDLINGIITIGDDLAKIESVGGGWYRCSIAYDQTNTSLRLYTTNAAATGNAAGTIFIQDAQLNYGLVAQDYVDTTTTSVVEGLTADLPRLDYSGGASCPSLLLEPSRTNLVEQSEYLNGSSWTLNNVVITNNAIASPEGVVNASKWAAASGFSLKGIYEVPTCASGVAHTSTAYFKADEYPLAFIRLGGITGNPYVIYDLRDESLVSTAGLTSHDIKSVGNGWYRIEATATTTTTFIAPNIAFLPESGYTLNVNNIPEYTGDGISGGYLYGAQLEAGSYPTSYIPTYGTSAGRGVDSALLSNSAALPTSYPFTLYAEVDLVDTTFGCAISLLDSSDFDVYYAIEYSSGFWSIWSRNTTNTKITSAVAPTIGRHKLVGVYTSTSLSLYIDGALAITGSNGQTFNTQANDVFIGQLRSVADNAKRDTIKQALVFNTALTDAEAIALTTI